MGRGNEDPSTTVDQVWEAADKTSKALEEGIQAASYAVKSGTVKAREKYAKAMESSQSVIDTGVAHYKHLEEQVFDKLRGGVHTAAEHQTATITALTGLALLILPGPRRFLYRHTFGRLQSEEAVFRSAQVKQQSITEALHSDAAEAQKLLQRQAAAEAQYDQGLQKLQATARQLRSLSSKVKATESAAERLVKTLRELPSKEALALRSEMATKAAAAKQQRAALERQLWAITKRGI
ncbi:RGS1-HXK1-interacting protein 1 [Coccomyxa sp. Obi]|nr:RGS1-HXK1-interacting protein 1 [Coccomyxa sp. Obi]